MKSTGRRVAIIAAWATAAVVGLGAVAGAANNVAFADPKSPTPTATDGPKDNGARDHAKRRPGKQRLEPELAARRALHGEFVVKKDGKFLTVLVQKGTVQAVDAKSITVKSADGFTKTYAIDGETRMRRNAKGEAGAFKVDDKVAVFAVKDGDTATAKRVFGRAPK